jgi:hypothetical protein
MRVRVRVRGACVRAGAGAGHAREQKKTRLEFFFCLASSILPRLRGRCAWFGGTSTNPKTIPFIVFGQAEFKTSLGGVICTMQHEKTVRLYHATCKNIPPEGGWFFLL